MTVLSQCGEDLTRENIMGRAANLKDVSGPTFMPGIKLDTSPTDFAPTKSMQPVRFDGKTWMPFGDLLSL